MNTPLTQVPARALRRALGSAALVAAATLSACGGDPAANEPEVIPSLPAATSLEFSQYVSKRLPDDTAEPLEVEAVSPPTSESEEPIDVA